jgi:hypothetical protein
LAGVAEQAGVEALVGAGGFDDVVGHAAGDGYLLGELFLAVGEVGGLLVYLLSVFCASWG